MTESECIFTCFFFPLTSRVLKIFILLKKGTIFSSRSSIVFRTKYWRFARNFDLHGFPRLDFGNALTAQIERNMHTDMDACVKILNKNYLTFPVFRRRKTRCATTRFRIFLCGVRNSECNVDSYKRRLLAKGEHQLALHQARNQFSKRGLFN